MKECFIALAVIESWALVFLALMLAMGRFDLGLVLAKWMVVAGLLAWLAYCRIVMRELAGQAKARRRSSRVVGAGA